MCAGWRDFYENSRPQTKADFNLVIDPGDEFKSIAPWLKFGFANPHLNRLSRLHREGPLHKPIFEKRANNFSLCIDSQTKISSGIAIISGAQRCRWNTVYRNVKILRFVHTALIQSERHSAGSAPCPVRRNITGQRRANRKRIPVEVERRRN